MTSHADYIHAAAAVALAAGGTFLWEAPEQATVSLNDKAVPAIVLGDYTTTTTTQSSRVVAAPLTLFFGDSVAGQGDSPEEHHAALGRMEELKARFFTALDSNPLVQIDAIRATPYTGVYEAMLDGLAVQFTLTVPVLRDCVVEEEPPVVAGFPYVFNEQGAFALA